MLRQLFKMLLLSALSFEVLSAEGGCAIEFQSSLEPEAFALANNDSFFQVYFEDPSTGRETPIGTASLVVKTQDRIEFLTAKHILTENGNLLEKLEDDPSKVKLFLRRYIRMRNQLDEVKYYVDPRNYFVPGDSVDPNDLDIIFLSLIDPEKRKDFLNTQAIPLSITKPRIQNSFAVGFPTRSDVTFDYERIELKNGEHDKFFLAAKGDRRKGFSGSLIINIYGRGVAVYSRDFESDAGMTIERLNDNLKVLDLSKIWQFVEADQLLSAASQNSFPDAKRLEALLKSDPITLFMILKQMIDSEFEWEFPNNTLDYVLRFLPCAVPDNLSATVLDIFIRKILTQTSDHELVDFARRQVGANGADSWGLRTVAASLALKVHETRHDDRDILDVYGADYASNFYYDKYRISNEANEKRLRNYLTSSPAEYLIKAIETKRDARFYEAAALDLDKAGKPNAALAAQTAVFNSSITTEGQFDSARDWLYLKNKSKTPADATLGGVSIESLVGFSSERVLISDNEKLPMLKRPNSNDLIVCVQSQERNCDTSALTQIAMSNETPTDPIGVTFVRPSAFGEISFESIDSEVITALRTIEN